MTENVADAVEAEIVALSSRLTEPGERECLRCFLLRMLAEFGCDSTCRWTTQVAGPAIAGSEGPDPAPAAAWAAAATAK